MRARFHGFPAIFLSIVLGLAVLGLLGGSATGESPEVDKLIPPPADEPLYPTVIERRDFTPDELTRHLKSEVGMLHFFLQVAAGEVSCQGVEEPCILTTDFGANVQYAYNRCMRLDPKSLRQSKGFQELDHGVVLSAVEQACDPIIARVDRTMSIESISAIPDIKEVVLQSKQILDEIGGYLR